MSFWALNRQIPLSLFISQKTPTSNFRRGPCGSFLHSFQPLSWTSWEFGNVLLLRLKCIIKKVWWRSLTCCKRKVSHLKIFILNDPELNRKTVLLKLSCQVRDWETGIIEKLIIHCLELWPSWFCNFKLSFFNICRFFQNKNESFCHVLTENINELFARVLLFMNEKT